MANPHLANAAQEHSFISEIGADADGAQQVRVRPGLNEDTIVIAFTHYCARGHYYPLFRAVD